LISDVIMLFEEHPLKININTISLQDKKLFIFISAIYLLKLNIILKDYYLFINFLQVKQSIC